MVWLQPSRLRAGAALAAGAAGTLTLPPFYLFPFLFLAFPVLVGLIDGNWRESRRGGGQGQAFAIGWWFGFGHFVTGLYWISNALQVNAEQFGWATPLAALALPAVLAVYTGLATLAAHWLWSSRASRVGVLALCWTAAEWLRGHLLTGFPWNLSGYAWGFSDQILQVTAVIGIYGLSLLTVFVAALPAVAGRTRSRSATWAPLGLAASLMIGAWGYGAARLAGATQDAVPGVVLRIVQPNIQQRLKWRRDRRQKNLDLHLDLMTSEGFDRISHVIWAEAAVPYYLANDTALRSRIGDRLGPGRYLLTGSLRGARDPDGSIRFWNSLLAIDGAGRVLETYDKAHLVPFGEYLPLRPFLAPLGLEKLTVGLADYAAGPGPRSLDIPGIPVFSPLICYEVIFPAAVTGPGPRPQWLLNVTNDAWYGNSTGPHQHLAMARVRAIEEGLPVVRAANTGISAIIDPYGRVIAKLGLNQRGVVDGVLPAAAAATLYSRFGDWLALSLAMVLAACVAISRYFQRQRET